MTHTASPAIADALRHKLDSRTARAGVIGLGYVGLPLAIELARAGFTVTGIDRDARKVAAINRGESYIQDVPTADVAVVPQGQQALGDGRPGGDRVARYDQHLRADAAAEDEGPGPLLCRVGRRGGRSASPPRHAHRPRIHHLSGYYGGSRPADSRARRPQGRTGLLPGLFSGARRSRQREVAHTQRAEGRRRPDAGMHGAGQSALRAPRWTPSSRSAHRRSPSW